MIKALTLLSTFIIANHTLEVMRIIWRLQCTSSVNSKFFMFFKFFYVHLFNINSTQTNQLLEMATNAEGSSCYLVQSSSQISVCLCQKIIVLIIGIILAHFLITELEVLVLLLFVFD